MYRLCTDSRPTLGVALRRAPISDKTTATNPDKCTKDQLGTLYPDILRVGTDQPVYPPWYMGDNPASGEGFESALAYAVAAKMNCERDDVRWVRVPFNAALAPAQRCSTPTYLSSRLPSSARPRPH